MRFIHGVALAIVLGAAACTNSGDASSDRFASTDAAPKVRAAIEDPAGLQTFPTDPLDGDGRILCVQGEEVRLYLFDSDAERAEAAALIDPRDPSLVGSAVVEWSGSPTFWEVGPALVLYLGADEELRDELVDGLGEPYATGRGRIGGSDAC